MDRINTIRAVHARLHASGRLRALGVANGCVCVEAEGRLMGRVLDLVGGSSRPEALAVSQGSGEALQNDESTEARSASANPRTGPVAPDQGRLRSLVRPRAAKATPEQTPRPLTPAARKNGRSRIQLALVSLHMVAAALKGMNSRGGFVGLRALANRLHKHHGCEMIHPLALTARLRLLGVPIRNFGGYYVDTGHPEIRRIIKEEA